MNIRDGRKHISFNLSQLKFSNNKNNPVQTAELSEGTGMRKGKSNQTCQA